MKHLHRELWIPTAAAAVIVGGAAILVTTSLRQPEIAAFAPTPRQPGEVGPRLDGPRMYTLDARDEASWAYFDFSAGSAVADPGPMGWDLAVRRFHVIANGGPGFFGSAGVADLGPVAFESVRRVPERGYAVTEAGRDSVNAAIERWYAYSWSSHVLTPRGHVYAVRTADGRYAKLEVVSYYCPGAMPGCLTFRYAYQGDGSRRVAPDPPGGPGSP